MASTGSSATRLSLRLLCKSQRGVASQPRLWAQAPVKGGRRHFSSSRRHKMMDMGVFTEEQLTVRDAIQKICARFPNEYWQQHDQTETDPKELHAALAADGWLGIALPEEFGGAGLGAGMAGAQSIHANVYATQPLAKFGNKEQLQSTIPNIISGQKIWITCAQVASKMILLARTTPVEEVKKPSEGLSLFCIDIDKSNPALELKKIKKMGGRAVDANEVFFDHYEVPAGTLIGEEGQGFKIILHGMNAERCLLAGEALGLGYAAVEKAAKYARERVVFGRPIGKNQAIAHPLADAFVNLEAAKLATYHAARLYDRSRTDKSITPHAVGVACNSAKYLAAEAAFRACERAVMTHGGMGYAMEYDVERYLREILVPRIAPVSREMILNFVSEKVLELPRSY
ncbi:acyl-CoA dehydrogenase NM domain-like protein, partial [Aureobasidium melanogenum]